MCENVLRVRVLSLLIAAVLVVPATGFAQMYDDELCVIGADCTQQPEAAASTVDARLGILEHAILEEGPDSVLFGPAGAPAGVDEEGAGVTLRFVEELTVDEVEEFERRGVEFERRDGEPIHVGSIYEGRIEWATLHEVAADERVERIEALWSPAVFSPLEETAEKVGAAQARAHPELDVDGDGVTVVDVDDGFDVFHPHMFRADGGMYEWHDEDETGEFTPGVDTVEIGGQRYTLEVLRSETISPQDPQGAEVEEEGEFRPDRDWLYADINSDGQRNVGPDEGFSESDPAYGEPLFVADDVDANGQLDPGEKLVRLDTSKFKRVVHDGHSYERGEDLIHASAAQSSTYHGTSVTSILGGGQQGYHERVGLAPGVEFIGYAYRGDQSQQQDGESSAQPAVVSALSDAIDSDAALVLHEWTDIVSEPFDGSTNTEQAMDDARDEGVLQVNPAGNLNDSGKHIHRDVDANEVLQLEFEIDEGFDYGTGVMPYEALYLSLFWVEGNDITATLVGPDGDEVPVDLEPQQTDGFALQAEYQETERGTRHLMMALWASQQGEPLPMGEYTLELEGFSHPEEVTGRLVDMYSSWGRGIEWEDETMDYGTAVYPASADSAIGVAAFGGRNARPDSAPGELRGYSGRGPRLGGDPVVDIAAPDDPFAAMSTVDERYEGVTPGAFITFGGTSGAGPHVAAAIALAAEKHPEWDADDIEQALLGAADTDVTPDHGSLPNRHWGYGKVDAFAMLSDESPPQPSSVSPSADLEIDVDEESEEVVFDASDTTHTHEKLQYRFDIGYDGDWDTEFDDSPTHTEETESFDYDREYTVRLQVRDHAGGASGALATFEVEEPEPEIELVEHQRSGCGSVAAGGTKIPVVVAVLLLLLVVRQTTSVSRRELPAG